MNDRSRMSCQANSQDSPNVISLRESEDGRMPCGSPDGPMLDPHGRDHVLASLSARQAKGKDLLTSGIYGLLGITSSASVDLALSLANKLKARFDTDGSILFKMTWKDLATPSGRSVCLLRASGRRTSDKEYGSWPTPQTIDGHGQGRAGRLKKDGNRDPSALGSYRMDLKDMVLLASWPTPTSTKLTPQSRDNAVLARECLLASWPTLAARDYKDRSEQNVPINALLGRTTWLCTYLAPTENTGQLNPRLSGWLMGYPIAWDLCAMRIPEKRSSTRSSKKAKPDSE